LSGDAGKTTFVIVTISHLLKKHAAWRVGTLEKRPACAPRALTGRIFPRVHKQSLSVTFALPLTTATAFLCFNVAAATKPVLIDPSLPWNGYRAVIYQNGMPTRYDYFPPGSATISQLQASINSTGTVVCAPDISMDANFHLDTNAWADASGTSPAICTVESTFYGDSTTVGIAGDTVIFSGMLVSNSLASAYSNSIIAFIKDYDSGWGLQGISSANLNTLTNGQPFTLARNIAVTGDHIQWGFEWSGPAARSNTVAGLGYAALARLPIPRGATVPWTTYESENMSYTGQLLGPSYTGHDVASESSGRQCVRLSVTGQYVQFTALSNATALVVRYSVPDTTDGLGADYTLGLYNNGTLVGHLPVTSRYSWLYGAYSFSNHPADGSPRNFFDEVRTNGLSINAGDVLRLQKDGSDAATWYDIDLVDLENPDAPLLAPANSISITNYGAIGDGNTDCTTALQDCIAAAQTQSKAVWIPAGTWLITTNISLPSNTTLQGAGMWHTKLVGSQALYNATPSRRVTLSGNGSNIHLADFAIVGCLNYRNDNEPNDGLGGSYGTGSTISRIWVEHTKTGAWLVNSSGLVVDGCRFRDTIADGINLCVGMRGTTVANCAARGTGDDCFATWPAAYITPVYPPGLNVITHCTGQTPFLANGGAIYGADSNRIEDCVFQDIPYQCGVLISTTFPVSSNFSGTTVVQRCDLDRCGGTPADPAGALQVCLQFRPISGLNLNNLTISNSVTYGMSIIYGGGPLSNAIMSNVIIPNYAIGGNGAHALWARADTRGSLTVDNSSIAEYQDDSFSFDFFFSPPPPQRILSVSNTAGNITLTYATAPWSTYHVESSPTISPPSWTVIPGSTTNATSRAVTFTAPVSPGSISRFYRIVSP